MSCPPGEFGRFLGRKAGDVGQPNPGFDAGGAAHSEDESVELFL
jgi:hypothetical protein